MTHEHILDAFEAELAQRYVRDQSDSVLKLLKWTQQRNRKVRSVLFSAMEEYNQSIPAEKPEPEPSEEAIAAFRRELAERFPIKLTATQKKMRLPVLPATLDELFSEYDRMVANGSIKKNPLPTLDQRKVSNAIGYKLGIPAYDPTDEHFMPEGVPPYPRRGESYTANELNQLWWWLKSDWGPSKELLAIAHRADRNLLQEGISPVRIRTLTQGREDVCRKFADEAIDFAIGDVNYRYEGGFAALTVDGKGPQATPQAWAEKVIASAGQSYRNALNAIRLLSNPDLYSSEMDPNEAYKIVYNAMGREAASNMMFQWYGLHPYTRITIKGKEETAAHWLYHDVPPTTVLRLAAEVDAKFREQQKQREQELKATKAKLAKALSVIPERNLVWGKANIKRHIPPGYEMLDLSSGAHIEFPNGGRHHIGKTWADMEQWLK